MIRHFGSLLMIASLGLLTIIYLPVLMAYLPNENKILDSSFDISIPKIDANAPIIDNVDPWKKSEYEEALKKGVARAKGYHNFLFAHSSLPPWQMTRTNTPFLRLGELKNGDQIIIHRGGKEYVYKVVGKKEIWPNQVEVLIDSSRDLLILQTCTPLGTDLKRLLIFAKLD